MRRGTAELAELARLAELEKQRTGTDGPGI
jgi:hypothetical protein